MVRIGSGNENALSTGREKGETSQAERKKDMRSLLLSASERKKWGSKGSNDVRWSASPKKG